MSIPQITIPNSEVKEVNIPNVWGADVNLLHPEIPYVPVTVEIGKPIVDMPGCVEAHELNKTGEGGTKNKQLAKDDDTVTFCDAGTPSFNAMDYTPEQLTITQDIPPPPVEPPPDPPSGTDVQPPKLPETEVECPAPNQPRVGDFTQDGSEKVVGHELQGTICVVLYEDTSVVEKYLPSTNQVSTTATIAVVATAAATATPLLLKVVKPIVKQLIKKIQKLLGKEPPKLSARELQTNKYREKKGLPPLKIPKKRK